MTYIYIKDRFLYFVLLDRILVLVILRLEIITMGTHWNEIAVEFEYSKNLCLLCPAYLVMMLSCIILYIFVCRKIQQRGGGCSSCFTMLGETGLLHFRRGEDLTICWWTELKVESFFNSFSVVGRGGGDLLFILFHVCFLCEKPCVI